MTEPVNNTLTFNDKEYSLEDISDKGKYIISQIQDLRKEGSGGPTVVRAYVVSSEVTDQQEADAKINDLARL